MSYEFEYEVQGAATFLVYRKQEDDIIDSMSMGMISNNKIDGIIPFIYTQVEDSVYFKYNVSARNTLQQYFSGVVTKKSFLGVLDSLVNAFLQAEEYMIDMSSVVLDTQYIFVDPASSEASVVVLPVSRESAETLESFVRSLLFSVQFDRTEDCAYIAELINFLNSNQFFSLADFKKLLNHMQNGSQRLENRGGMQDLNTRTEVERSAPIPEFVPIQPVVPVAPVTPAHADTSSIPGKEARRILTPPIPPMPESGKGTPVWEQTAKETTTKREKAPIFSKTAATGVSGRPAPPPFVVQTAEGNTGKSAPAPQKPPEINRKGFFGKKEKDNTEKAEKTGKKERKRIVIPGKDAEQDKTAGGRPVFPQKETAVPRQNVQGELFQTPNQDFGKTVDLSTYKSGTTVLLGNDSVGTTVLIQPKRRFFLYRRRTGEEFEISGNRTRIGRDASKNEICLTGNSAISSEHAVFVNQNDFVCLTDSQSTNGTFVNGLQLKAGVASEILQNGTEIRLADEEFEFRIKD